MTPRHLARTGLDGILEGAGMILGGVCLIVLAVRYAVGDWDFGKRVD